MSPAPSVQNRADPANGPDDLLSIRRAAACFERDPEQIEDDIMQNRLPCGVLARGWKGLALPERPEYIGGHWQNDVIDADRNIHGQWVRTYGCRCTVTVNGQPCVVHELTVQECRAGGFWYLEQVAHEGDNIGGFEALLLDRQPCVVQILGPWRGDCLHRHSPSHFPPPPFLVWLRDKPTITHDDVRVLAADLDALYSLGGPVAVDGRADLDALYAPGGPVAVDGRAEAVAPDEDTEDGLLQRIVLCIEDGRGGTAQRYALLQQLFNQRYRPADGDNKKVVCEGLHADLRRVCGDRQVKIPRVETLERNLCRPKNTKGP